METYQRFNNLSVATKSVFELFLRGLPRQPAYKYAILIPPSHLYVLIPQKIKIIKEIIPKIEKQRASERERGIINLNRGEE
jgi:hypothetical protein